MPEEAEAADDDGRVRWWEESWKDAKREGQGEGRGRGRTVVGLAVVCGWMGSTARQLGPHARLLTALHWKPLLCRPPTLNLWRPAAARTFAQRVLLALATELLILSNPTPLAFILFSGAPKAFYYQLLRLLQEEGTEEARLVRACAAIEVYDSAPIDFRSNLGVKFLTHDVDARTLKGRALASAARTAAWMMDAVALSTWEQQRADFWDALENSPVCGPVLLLYSQDDKLAAATRIDKFARDLRRKGRRVTAVRWKEGSHVGLLRKHPTEYRLALSSALAGAAESWHRNRPRGENDAGVSASTQQAAAPAAPIVSSRL
eukprot:jgi/Chlat1/2597/Chrsp178S02452